MCPIHVSEYTPQGADSASCAGNETRACPTSGLLEHYWTEQSESKTRRSQLCLQAPPARGLASCGERAAQLGRGQVAKLGEVAATQELFLRVAGEVADKHDTP
jgi:hypothetical protein